MSDENYNNNEETQALFVSSQKKKQAEQEAREFRIHDNRSCDTNSLSLTSGECVNISTCVFWRKSNSIH